MGHPRMIISCLNQFMNRKVLLISLLLSGSSFATTLAVIRTPKGVFVAADSYRISWGKDTGPFCKIMQVNESFIALAGTPDIEVRENNKPRVDLSFHALPFAKHSAQTKGTMIAKGASFVALAMEPFKRSVEVFKQTAPERYQKELLGHAQSLEVVFFGMNPNNIPAFEVVDFGVSEDGKGQVIVSPSFIACPSPTCGDDSNQLAILGANERAKVASQDPRFFTGDGATDVRRLVEIEIANRPDVVKAPVDVMQVTVLGATWIYRKPQCADIQPYSPPSSRQSRKRAK